MVWALLAATGSRKLDAGRISKCAVLLAEKSSAQIYNIESRWHDTAVKMPCREFWPRDGRDGHPGSISYTIHNEYYDIQWYINKRNIHHTCIYVNIYDYLHIYIHNIRCIHLLGYSSHGPTSIQNRLALWRAFDKVWRFLTHTLDFKHSYWQ